MISGSLADLSRESVGKLLRRPTKNSSVGMKKHDNSLHERGSTATVGPITLTFLFILFYNFKQMSENHSLSYNVILMGLLYFFGPL